MDSNTSQPPVSTSVYTGMHKEDQQATGVPTSLGVTSEARANPQLSSDKTKFVSDGLESILTTPEIGTSNVVKTSKDIKFGAIKLEDLAKLVPNVKVDFKNLDSPEDDPIIVVDDSEEDEEEHKNEKIHSTTNDETKDILASTPPSPSSLPTKLKDLPSKFNELTEEVKGLKQKVHELELKLSGDLKDISSKLEDFTKTVTSLTLEVAKLKTLQWEILAKFLSLPVQGDQTKINKGKKAMSLKDAKKESTKSNSNDERTHMSGSMVESSNKKELKGFDFVTKDEEHVYLTKKQINAQKKIKEVAKAKAARREGGIEKEEMIDLLGPKVERMDYLRTTKAELGIDLDRPLSEQDPLDRLNDLEKKKRKHGDDIHDFFRANKRLKSSAQYKDHPAEFRDFLNTMLYTVQEIFFRLHQGLGLDDHARTFSSFLLAKIDK
nr:hypothetical protein [Tanacetum cinerariifolium]